MSACLRVLFLAADNSPMLNSGGNITEQSVGRLAGRRTTTNRENLKPARGVQGRAGPAPKPKQRHNLGRSSSYCVPVLLQIKTGQRVLVLVHSHRLLYSFELVCRPGLLHDSETCLPTWTTLLNETCLPTLLAAGFQIVSTTLAKYSDAAA